MTQRDKIRIDILTTLACEFTGLTRESILSDSRKREIVDAKRAICGVFMEDKDRATTLSDTGSFFNKDHATALYYQRTAKHHEETEPNFREFAQYLRQNLEIRTFKFNAKGVFYDNTKVYKKLMLKAYLGV